MRGWGPHRPGSSSSQLGTRGPSQAEAQGPGRSSPPASGWHSGRDSSPGVHINFSSILKAS